MKHLILTSYDTFWLDKIEEDVLNFTHKTAKEIMAHLLIQCMKITNREKRTKLKET